MWNQFFSGELLWFSLPATVGTALFALKLVLMLVGGEHHDALSGHDVSLDHAPDLHDHPGADSADTDLKLLSIQGVLGFLMGFGWAGLLVLNLTRAQLVVALAAALVAGVAVMYAMAVAMRSLARLQASGNVTPRAAIGAEGTVYVTIPADGRHTGQVTVVIDQKQRTYNAVAAADHELARNARVRVVGIEGDSTLRVEPV